MLNLSQSGFRNILELNLLKKFTAIAISSVGLKYLILSKTICTKHLEEVRKETNIGKIINSVLSQFTIY